MGILFVLGVGFGALGVMLMGVSAAAILRARREAASRVSGWGVVAALQPRAGLRGSILCPVVHFQTETGELVTFHSSMGGQPPLHAIGQRVAVFYSREKPDGAELEAPAVLWLVPAGMFAVGLIFAAVGTMMVLGFGLLAVSSAGSG
ncbi:MAG TPA: DUF3592 domain-containing protein [Longimicrobium sp.]|jgi:hypothetical protein|nr:DUF3592 domain-containing protein [Longimicrobium sp.]